MSETQSSDWVPTEPCCEVWPKICGFFNWYTPANDNYVRTMCNIPTVTDKWRVNYCPSCGKEIRGVVMMFSDIADSREQLVP